MHWYNKRNHCYIPSHVRLSLANLYPILQEHSYPLKVLIQVWLQLFVVSSSHSSLSNVIKESYWIKKSKQYILPLLYEKFNTNDCAPDMHVCYSDLSVVIEFWTVKRQNRQVIRRPARQIDRWMKVKNTGKYPLPCRNILHVASNLKKWNVWQHRSTPLIK